MYCSLGLVNRYRSVVVGLSFQKLKVSPSLRALRRHQSATHKTGIHQLVTTYDQQSTTRKSSTPSNNSKTTPTHNSTQCLSSSAALVLSLLPQRRSQQQSPRSRWSPTCSTSKSLCAQSLRMCARVIQFSLLILPSTGSSTPALRSAFLLSTAKPTLTRASPSASTAA